MENAMIELKSLSMSYGNTKVFENIDLSIARGSKTVIIGPSGGGKSTLLRCMNLFERPTAGEVIVDGKNLLKLKKKELCQARMDMGMVFQAFNLYGHLNVLDNLTTAPIRLRHMSREEAEALAFERLEAVGLKDKAYSMPYELSGGQQQRVAIARAFCMKPKIMFFDEPTSALDPEMIKEVLDIMMDAAKDKDVTMVFVTHEMGFAKNVADRILFLADGAILADGSPDEVLLNPDNLRIKSFLSKILIKNAS